MQLTIFGVLWICVTLLCFFTNDCKKIVFLALFSMVLQCNSVLILGGTGIGVQIFTACAAWVRLLIEKRKNKQPLSGLIILFVALYFSVILSMLTNGLLKSDAAITLIMLAVYVLFAISLINGKVLTDEKWLIKTENFIIWFVLIVGFLQVLTKLGVLPLTSVLETFIYNEASNPDVIFHTKSTAAFYSSFMEPSFCGAFLVGAFGLVVLRKQITLKDAVMTALLVVAIILTRSSTAYGGLAIVFFLLCFVRTEKKLFKTVFPLLIIGLLVVFVYNPDILDEVIFNKSSTSSFAVRQNWNEAALKQFYESPFFGGGYRTARASSILYTLLGEMGVLGIVIYASILLYYISRLFVKKANSTVTSAIFVLGVMICQIIACPDLNFSPFWLAVFVHALYLTSKTDDASSMQNEKATPKIVAHRI